jgi:hypothetical protein
MLIRDIKKNFYDKATHQRICEHIANINDIITDEDLKNIKTNWNSNEVSSTKEIENLKAGLYSYKNVLLH